MTPDDGSVGSIGAASVEGLDHVWPGTMIDPPRPARGANKRAPTDADAAVGRRIRDCRIAMGMPLGELSGRVGVSQPQLYRYECGLTRVAASRLIAIAASLGVSVETLTGGSGHHPIGAVDSSSAAEIDLLLHAFSNIVRPERRSALIALARSMAETEAAPQS
jgi:transcriptional regulator with XRE-family HTH domain